MSLVVDAHREFLGDFARVAAFREALRQRVRPGDVVIDLGAGTGVLGLLACEAGASRVYAVEPSGLIEVARRVAIANGFGDRIVYVNALAAHANLPEQADGIVADQIGHFGFEAGLFEMMADARRLLKPGAWTVPLTVQLEIAPVSNRDVRGRLDFWRSPVAGIDFSAARQWAANTGYPTRIDPGELLGRPAAPATVSVPEISTARIAMRATLPIDRAGTLDGIGGWFRSELAPGVFMTNAPGAPVRLQRRNVVLPLETSVAVLPGDSVEVQVHILPSESIVAWRGRVHHRDGTSAFSHSTLRGMLLTSADLRRLAPSTVPRLTERGRARLSVLELCDGRRSLGEIEQQMRARHPVLFRTAAEAAVFVAEVVSRYSE
jgi:protein arginine N-methyltransferase 1